MVTYHIYCSKCNKQTKNKMSWIRYMRYMAMDGRSKGYQEIEDTFTSNKPPTKCIFGHLIDTSRTKIIQEN